MEMKISLILAKHQQRFTRCAIMFFLVMTFAIGAFAEKPIEHPGLRAAVDAGDYAKVRSFVKLGVRDVYCGEMPTDTAKAIWSKRWKEDPSLAKNNCERQFRAAFPAMLCQGPKAKKEECAAALLKASENVDDFLVIAKAALTNQTLKRETVDFFAIYPCTKNDLNEALCNCRHESGGQFLGMDEGWSSLNPRVVNKQWACGDKSWAALEFNVRGTGRSMSFRHKLAPKACIDFMELVEKDRVAACEKKPFKRVRAKKSYMKTFIAILGEARLYQTMYGCRRADLTIKWAMVLRELQAKFKIFEGVADNVIPGTSKWVSKSMDARLMTTGEFSPLEVDLYCAIAPEEAKKRFETFSLEYKCREVDEKDATKNESGCYISKGRVNIPSAKDPAVVSIGARSKSEVISEIERMTRGLFSIYMKYLDDDPGFHGEIVLRLIVTSAGKVAQISAEVSTTNSTSFDSEIMEKIKSSFSVSDLERYNEMGSSTITIPISFE